MRPRSQVPIRPIRPFSPNKQNLLTLCLPNLKGGILSIASPALMEATYVPDDTRKIRLLKTARALICRDGTAFTISALCEESGLSRSQFRRLFSTKAEFLGVLAQEVAEKSKSKSTPFQAREIKDDWTERRFRVLERAVTTLEARLDAWGTQRRAPELPGRARCGTAQEAFDVTPISEASSGTAAISHVSGASGLATASVVVAAPDTVLQIDIGAPPPGLGGVESPVQLVPTLESPPILEMPPEIATNIQPLDHEPGSDGRPPCECAFLGTENDLSYTPVVEPEGMRTVLNKARAQANKAAEVESEQRVSRFEGQKLTLFVSASVVLFGLIIGVVSSYHLSHAPQKTYSGQKAIHKAPTFTIINATGADDPPGEWIKSITRQAARGDARSQSKLALAYLRGDGVGVDPVAAIGWSRMAAAQGEPTAEFILATIYANGIKPDPQSAVHWFEAAASRGNLKAMHNLAIAYLNGSGVSKDTTAALTWFGKAASSGYRDSAFDLAVLYERGEGVPQDPRLALRWYTVAASQGDREAARRIDLLKTELPQTALQ